MKLIVNPLAAIEPLEGSDILLSSGPVPGRGMKILELSPSDQPRLHSLFKELLSLGLQNLDIKSDLDESDVPLLQDHGVLVDADHIPERPLFSCMLADVEETSLVPEALVVNPTLEFQPFDLTKFRSWMQEKHLSPHNATVWVTDPKTQIRWGYWLDPAQAEFVKNLVPGSAVSKAQAADLVGKLVAANIFIDPENDSSTDFDQAADKFARDRYAILTDLIPPAQLRALQSYFRKYVEQGFMKFGDDQVARRFVEHGEAVASMIHAAIEPVMTAITRDAIQRTYAYNAVYEENAVLLPHTDREACEYSFSFQLDYAPELETGVSPWPLYISSNAPGDLNVNPERDTAVHLPNGGFLAYKGRELIHYRKPLFAGHRSSSIFFHYVPADESGN